MAALVPHVGGHNQQNGGNIADDGDEHYLYQSKARHKVHLHYGIISHLWLEMQENY